MKTTKQTRSQKKAEIDSGNTTVYAPYDTLATPSSAMLGHIGVMFQLLELNGIDVSGYKNKGHYKTRHVEAKQLISELHKIARDHDIDYENVNILYVNVCKDKKTKKKIHYKTKHRLGHPVGYDYVGTLRMEVSIEKEGNKSERST